MTVVHVDWWIEGSCFVEAWHWSHQRQHHRWHCYRYSMPPACGFAPEQQLMQLFPPIDIAYATSARTQVSHRQTKWYWDYIVYIPQDSRRLDLSVCVILKQETQLPDLPVGSSTYTHESHSTNQYNCAPKSMRVALVRTRTSNIKLLSEWQYSKPRANPRQPSAPNVSCWSRCFNQSINQSNKHHQRRTKVDSELSSSLSWVERY